MLTYKLGVVQRIVLMDLSAHELRPEENKVQYASRQYLGKEFGSGLRFRGMRATGWRTKGNIVVT